MMKLLLAFALIAGVHSQSQGAARCVAMGKIARTDLPKDIISLQKINDELARSDRMSIDDLVRKGFIELGNSEVKDPSNQDAKLPVIEVLLPFARTGVLFPDFALDIKDRGNLETIVKNAYKETWVVENEHKQKETVLWHRGILLAAPGNGSDNSTAKSVIKMASTFHQKTKKRGAKDNPVNPAVRLASFSLDLPGNGMGTGAPVEFLSEPGMIEVFRHARLIFKHLYGDKPFFGIGRSHAASVWQAYGHRYDDIDGVISMNPLLPWPHLFSNMVRNQETPELAFFIFGKPLSLHEPSWRPALRYWPEYTLHKTRSLVPELILFGKSDPTFGKLELSKDETGKTVGKLDLSEPLDALNDYLSAQSELRQALIVEGGGHDLFVRENRDVFKQVIDRTSDFVLSIIERRKNE